MTRARRVVVGAHYGLTDWLAQRLTAIVMAAYTLLVLAIVGWQGGLDHAGWAALWSQAGFRLASFVFAVALVWHAWVGVRNILMDYVKPPLLRLALQALAVLALVVYLGWTVQILFGGVSR